MKHAWVLVLALTACSKKKEKEPAPGPAPATGTAPAPAPSIDAAAAPTPPAAGAVALTAGQAPTLGCFGWSDKLGAAACFTGTTGLGVDFETKLQYAGAAGAPIAVTETLDSDTIDGANKYLADNGFAALAPAVPLTAGKDVTAGGIVFSWTRKQTGAGGDNQPPTYKDVLVATCGAKKLTLLDTETEGGDLAVTVHAQTDRVLVIQAMHVGREGESSDTVDAVVIDPAACAATGT